VKKEDQKWVIKMYNIKTKYSENLGMNK